MSSLEYRVIEKELPNTDTKTYQIHELCWVNNTSFHDGDSILQAWSEHSMSPMGLGSTDNLSEDINMMKEANKLPAIKENMLNTSLLRSDTLKKI